MKHIERGVIGHSYIDFTVPSEFAREALYCCPQSGHFYVDSKYDVSRAYYDWFLIFYICSGSMILETEGHTYTAAEGQIALLDCHAPHRYYCPDRAEFMWFHYHGNSSAAYSKYLTERGNIIFSGDQIKDLRKSFSNILHLAASSVIDEHLLSRDISGILCTLATSRRSSSLISSPVTPAINYILEHFSEPIDLDQMAELCMISKPHLIRCFQKEVNCPPHDYLLQYRLRQAQQMLSGTALSVEEIAEKCGFNSVSHFSRAFKKRVNMTPSEFRRLW